MSESNPASTANVPNASNNSNTSSDAPNAAATSMLDAYLADCSRLAMAQRAAMAPGANGNDDSDLRRAYTQDSRGLAEFAGATADSFAQAFVDRWAGAQTGLFGDNMYGDGLLNNAMKAAALSGMGQANGVGPHHINTPAASQHLLNSLGYSRQLSGLPLGPFLNDPRLQRSVNSIHGEDKFGGSMEAAAAFAAHIQRVSRNNGASGDSATENNMDMRNFGMANHPAGRLGANGLCEEISRDRYGALLGQSGFPNTQQGVIDTMQAFQNQQQYNLQQQQFLQHLQQQQQQQQQLNWNNSLMAASRFNVMNRTLSGSTGRNDTDMMMPPMYPYNYAAYGLSHPAMFPINQQQQEAIPSVTDSQSHGESKRSRPTVKDEPDPSLIEASKGPFMKLDRAIPLALEEDKEWLTPLHCFVRRYCVEVFTASEEDVKTPSKGKRKPIQVLQVGIRCPHCNAKPEGATADTNPFSEDFKSNHERGSVYYPTTLSTIYNATMNLLQRHIRSCTKVPKHIMDQYTELKKDDARSGTSKRYWIESAKSLGFIDTTTGIKLRADAPPSLLTMSLCLSRTNEDSVCANKTDAEDESSSFENDEKKSNMTLAVKSEEEEEEGEEPMEEDGDSKFKENITIIKTESDNSDKINNESGSSNENPDASSSVDTPPLVLPSDKELATSFSFLLLSQMKPCVFTEVDRLGKRKGLPTGFAGLACRHCFGGYGSGRFFPSSIKTLSDTSKTLNVVHNHMVRCRKCPKEVIDELAETRKSHDDERANMKFGSQKAFFAKIWARLHYNRNYDSPVNQSSQSTKNTSDQNDALQESTTDDSVHFPFGLNNSNIALMGGAVPGAVMGSRTPADLNMGMMSYSNMREFNNSMAMIRGYMNYNNTLQNVNGAVNELGISPSNRFVKGDLDVLSDQATEVRKRMREV